MLVSSQILAGLHWQLASAEAQKERIYLYKELFYSFVVRNARVFGCWGVLGENLINWPFDNLSMCQKLYPWRFGVPGSFFTVTV